MGLFTGIRTLFGSKDAVSNVAEKAADGLYNGLDKLIYTEEEKSEAFAQAREQWLQFVAIAYDQNSIRSITRRWLAWLVCGWVVINAQVAIVYAILGKEESVNAIIRVAEAMNMGWAFITVLVFYFGVHTLRALSSGKTS